MSTWEVVPDSNMNLSQVELRATPPRPHQLSEDIEGRVKLYIQGNLQHVSTEFLGNHENSTLGKLYIQGNLQHVSTEIRTPVKLYI